MKKIFLVSLLFSQSIGAQITINSSDFATVNDTVRVSVLATNIDQLNYETTGPNMTWDFSSLSLDSQRVTNYRPISETNALFIQPYFGSGADAAHQASYYTKIDGFAGGIDTGTGIAIDAMSKYTKVTSNNMTAVGYSASISGLPFAIPSDSIEVVYKFPMNFEDKWSSKGNSALDLSFLNFAFKQFRTRTSEVDGWGTITTPFGTFEALRVKHFIEEIDSVLIEIDTTQGPQWLGSALPPSFEYEWITKGQKEPILRINTSIIGGFQTITSVVYRDIYREVPTTGLKQLNPSEVKIYPNPAGSELHIRSAAFLQNYEIRTLDGKLIQQASLNSTQAQVGLENLTPGLYLIHLRTNNGILIKKFHKQ